MFRYLILSSFLGAVVDGQAEAPEGGCLVCGDGKVITNPDEIFAYPNNPEVSCQVLESSGLAGAIPLDLCAAIAFLPEMAACGCAEGNLPTTATGAPVMPPTLAPVSPAPIVPVARAPVPADADANPAAPSVVANPVAPAAFAPTVEDVLFNENQISMPRVRFQLWSDLEFQDLAAQAGYDEAMWENPGTNPIESRPFRRIQPDDTLAALVKMGFNTLSWDCWILHYSAYSWNGMVNIDVAQYYEVLGWTESSWNGDTGAPDSNNKGWSELSADEKQAATNLCYLPQLWNEIPFRDMLESSPYLDSIEPWNSPAAAPVVAPVAPNAAPSFEAPTVEMALYNEDEISIPRFRFQLWSELGEIQDLAIQVGYDESSWNTLGMNPIENDAFLMQSSQAILSAMGFTEATWDCWINHYAGYTWLELKRWGRARHWENLGYTESSWNGESDAPASSQKGWNQFTPKERLGATNVCYLPQTWNVKEFSDWLSTSPYLASTEPWIVVETNSPVTVNTEAPVVPNETSSPVTIITEAPVVPLLAPVVAPSAAPVVPPSAAPVVAPSAAPVVPPSAAPVVPPSAAPVVPPSAAPVPAENGIPCPSVPPGGCSICGEGLCITNFRAMFSAPGLPHSGCHHLQGVGYRGELSDNKCRILPKIVGEICSCASSIPAEIEVPPEP